VVPEGSTYCNWFDDAERVKDGTVVAEAERVINDANSKVINEAKVSNLVFFLFPTPQLIREVKTVLNKNLVEKRKRTWLSHVRLNGINSI
jgi:hypothetical protein